jgi:hypothetical protein
MQIIAYADDVALIARTQRDLVEGFRSLECAAMSTEIRINQNKTKCKKTARSTYHGNRAVHI